MMVLNSQRKWRGEGEEERKGKREDKGMGDCGLCCVDGARFPKEVAI